MEDLTEIIYNGIKNSVLSWRNSDIYSISFYVYDDEDDPSKPTVTVGYNTEEHYNESINDASSAAEARWNYAFWLQNEEYSFGYDDHSAKLIQAWILKLGLPTSFTSDEDYEHASKITEAFVNILVVIALRLHSEGIIVKKFGQPIPILIHELEYYDEIAEQTKKANPENLAADFVAWIDDGCC